MSIINGLFAGRSGISSHGSAIAVVGDNISNSSTVGFKASRAEFEDLIAGGASSGRTIGSGSSLAAVTNIFQQGTLEFTSRPLDLAVDGNGYFVVADGAQRFYTRAGNFKVDSDGTLIDQAGRSVLGTVPGTGGSLQAINVNNAASQNTIRTNAVDIAGNLDAGANTILAAAIDPNTFTTLNSNSEFSTVVDVFDSLGDKHTVTMFFWHTNANEYQVRAYVDGSEVSGGTAGDPSQIGNSLTLTFNSSGVLQTSPAEIVANTGTVTPLGGISWTNGAATDIPFTLDFAGFSQFAATSNVTSITQDGQGVGAVTSVSVESNGDIFALLDNGQASIIGTVGLVGFANPEGLQRIGSNLLQQSQASGEPIVGQAESGTFGSIQSGSLELSAVDIASEFVKIITLQRGFQASARMITTIDQLLNEVIQLA